MSTPLPPGFEYMSDEELSAWLPDKDNGGGSDPLEGLVEKSANDPGAAFMPEVLKRLVALKKKDRAAFEALRARLKRAGCRVTALDEVIAEETDNGREPTQGDILIDLVDATALFHSADGTAFADIEVGGHRETWPVRTKGFRRWLARQFFEETGAAPQVPRRCSPRSTWWKPGHVSTDRNGRCSSVLAAWMGGFISILVTPLGGRWKSMPLAGG